MPLDDYDIDPPQGQAKAPRTPEYLQYHQKVVDACVELMGENWRTFFDKECSYEEEFVQKRDPVEVALDQLDSF